MSRTRFLANDEVVETDSFPLAPALDFIRGRLGLTGTKEGCREGDCGACAVLRGSRDEGAAVYRAVPSCLLSLGELEGCHLVTIEGLTEAGASVPGAAAPDGLTPVMRAIAEANGSQCGFCSPGFVISLTAYLANGDRGSGSRPEGGGLSVEGALSAIEGNLCRCTGYGAIKRAASRLVQEFSFLPEPGLARLEALVDARVLPASCLLFAKGELLPRLAEAEKEGGAARGRDDSRGGEREAALFVGGGTDFLVRNPRPEARAYASVELLDRDPELKRITRRSSAAGEVLEIGAAVSWRQLFSSHEVLALVPGIGRYEALLASPLVRERATVGGNIVNASPVGDLTSMLIALGARVRITRRVRLTRDDSLGEPRELELERLFLGYKKLDLGPGEIVEAVLLPAEGTAPLFNFEKASKRERLDIAAVNSAAAIELEAPHRGEATSGGEGAGAATRIRKARISAGGVAPTPLLLEKTSAFLEGALVDASTALEASHIAASEVSPIGDIRGSAEYRRRVLGRLVLAHFVELFPGSGLEEAVS